MYQVPIKFRLAEIHMAKERSLGRKITAKEVAQAVGITEFVFSNMKLMGRGKVYNPGLVNLVNLCHYYGCTLNDMVEISGAPVSSSIETTVETPCLEPLPQKPLLLERFLF